MEELKKQARELFNGFIEKWCPDNYAHFIVTDENEAERYRLQIDLRIEEAHSKGVKEGLKRAVEFIKERSEKVTSHLWYVSDECLEDVPRFFSPKEESHE